MNEASKEFNALAAAIVGGSQKNDNFKLDLFPEMIKSQT
jgi:hypothetical protein